MPVNIIGINEDGIQGLSERSINLIKCSEVIFGGKRHLELVKDIIDDKKKTYIIGADTQGIVNEIKKNFLEGKNVVVLNSGDPLFYGLAKRVIDEIGKDSVEIIPNVSSIQLAFSRIKENWEDAKILSIHSKAKNLDDHFYDIIENSKILLLTYGKEDPKKVAKFLIDNNIKIHKFFVLENLGGPNERVQEVDIYNIQNMEFSPLNIVIILKDSERRKFKIGIPEEEFEHVGGLITKSEIRAIAISKLSLSENSVVWDIGGGSGSVSIECAMIARKGKVFCIEKNEKFCGIIRRNAEKFSVKNIEIIAGKAPEVLKDLPDPDSVFVGGSGDEIEEIISECVSRNPKNIVFTFVDIFHLTRALSFIGNKINNYKNEVSFINVMKLKEIQNYHRFEQTTGVFILWMKRAF